MFFLWRIIESRLFRVPPWRASRTMHYRCYAYHSLGTTALNKPPQSKIIFSFVHFLSYIFVCIGRGGSSPWRSWNTSRDSTISVSSATVPPYFEMKVNVSEIFYRQKICRLYCPYSTLRRFRTEMYFVVKIKKYYYTAAIVMKKEITSESTQSNY